MCVSTTSPTFGEKAKRLSSPPPVREQEPELAPNENESNCPVSKSNRIPAIATSLFVGSSDLGPFQILLNTCGFINGGTHHVVVGDHMTHLRETLCLEGAIGKLQTREATQRRADGKRCFVIHQNNTPDWCLFWMATLTKREVPTTIVNALAAALKLKVSVCRKREQSDWPFFCKAGCSPPKAPGMSPSPLSPIFIKGRLSLEL